MSDPDKDIVTGTHVFPSDVRRPEMYNGKVLNHPAYGAKLKTIDLMPIKGEYLKKG